MKKLLLTLCALFVLTHNQPAYANEVIVTNEDVLVDSETVKDIDISTDKGSTFTVSVPILRTITSQYWFNYKYCDYYFCTDVRAEFDLASDEQLVVTVDESIMLTPDGGLKEPIEWLAYIPEFHQHGGILTADSMPNWSTSTGREYGQDVFIKPNKDMTAGLWRGYLKVNVHLEERGFMLNKENFEKYISSDFSATSITIPEHVTIDGLQMKVYGIESQSLANFTNLTDIYLETTDRFIFSDAFNAEQTTSPVVTIHGNNNVVRVVDYGPGDLSLSFDNCLLSIRSNPYNGYTTRTPNEFGKYMSYNTIDDFDLYDVIDIDYIYGRFTEININPNVKYFRGYALQNVVADKINIPNFKYLNGYNTSLFGACGMKEVECSNYFIGDRWFTGCTRLEKVVLNDGVEYIDELAFEGCTSLDEIIIPESVKYIAPSAFDGTPFLANLKKDVEHVYINGIWIAYGDKFNFGEQFEVPAGLTTLALSTLPSSVKSLSFEEASNSCSVSGTSTSISSIDITDRYVNIGYITNIFPNLRSAKLGGKTVSCPSFQYCNSVQEIELCEGLGYIGDYDFNHVPNFKGTSLYIPSSVYAVGTMSPSYKTPGTGWSTHTFYDFGKDSTYNGDGSIASEGFSEFIMESDAPYYTVVDGVLYTKDLSALVSIPRAKEFPDGVYTMPNEVKMLGELTFSRNKRINEVIISDALEIFSSEKEIAKAYGSLGSDGNYYMSILNKGNSLSIATYQFTNIQKFTTRPTNPNYTSVDGILYTKDLKELVAVPNHYQGAVVIPEGCEKIRENAFWLNYESGGVHDGVTSIVIPTSMRDIDTKQLDYINRRWASKTTVKIGNNNYIKYAGRVVKASTIENRVAWDGGTGTYWFNSVAGNIGSDPSVAWARYNPIYIPEGIYSFEVTDTTYGVPYYHIIFGTANGSVTSLNLSDNSLRYTTEKGYFASEKGGCFAFISMCYIDNATDKKSVGDMNSEMATALLNSLKIEKVSDLPITPKVGYSSSDGVITRTGNDARASLRNIYEVNPDSTYKVRLSSDAGNYMFGAFAVVDINKVSVDSGWLATDVDYVLSGCEGITFNFKKADNTAMTYEDAINISKYFTIEELTGHTHNYNLVHVDADCIYDGYDEYSCECTHSYKEIILATGHNLVDNVCSVCGGYGVITEEVASGHYDEYNKISKTWDELISSGLVTVSGTTLTKVSTSLKGTLVIDNSITQISNSAMSNCTQLTKVIILNDDATLGIYVFSKCSNLKEVILPDNLVRIPNSTFEDCMVLEVADIPESVTEIGPKAFWHCDALKEVTLPSNVTYVGREAFCFCRSVETLTIPATLTTFDYREFCWMNNLSTVYLMHEEVPEFGSQLFAKWGGVKTTFYFKNQAMYDAFTTTSYIDSYTIKSDNFDW